MRTICSLKYKLIKANSGCKASSIKANFGCKASSDKGLVNKDVLFFSISVCLILFFLQNNEVFLYIYISYNNKYIYIFLIYIYDVSPGVPIFAGSRF